MDVLDSLAHLVSKVHLVMLQTDFELDHLVFLENEVKMDYPASTELPDVEEDLEEMANVVSRVTEDFPVFQDGQVHLVRKDNTVMVDSLASWEIEAKLDFLVPRAHPVVRDQLLPTEDFSLLCILKRLKFHNAHQGLFQCGMDTHCFTFKVMENQLDKT